MKRYLGTIEVQGERNVYNTIEAMAVHIIKQPNPWVSHMEFERKKQKEGEKFDNFYLALTEFSEIADFCGNCKEQRIVVRIQEGHRDLARTLSQTTFPTLTQALL